MKAILITVIVTLTINIITELVVIYFVHKLVWTKKRLKWRVEWDLKNSALVDENFEKNIGTYSGLLASVKARYDNLKEVNSDFGYEYKKLSEQSTIFLQKELKPFLSKYHPFLEKLDLNETKEDKKLRSEFKKDFIELRKKTSEFLNKI